MKKEPGSLLISLDFELMWGMFDKTDLATYGQNIANVQSVVPRLLDLFAQRNIHATWATVGMLMYPSKNSLAGAVPLKKDQPPYKNSKLSSYNHLKNASIDERDVHYFAPELVEKIINTPGQELASHTFSHYYTLERQVGGEGEAFAADCLIMQKTCARLGQSPTSIIFPRNQWNAEALATIKQFGFTAFRGTENHFLYKTRTDKNQNNLLIRGLRLMDHYLNLSGHHTYPLPPKADLINLPASRFLRPCSSRLAFLEKRRLRRLKNSMTHAAQHGEVFHLWWHPHNFGANTEANFKILIELLEHYQHLKNEHDMRSLTMQEAATLAGE